MSGQIELPGDFRDLLDDYCSGAINDDDLRRLEALLLENQDARHEFVAYFQLHTELQFELRARQAADLVLDQVERNGAVATPAEPGYSRSMFRLHGRSLRAWWPVAAAALVVAIGLVVSRAGWRMAREAHAPGALPTPNIAWLINAQDCQWAGDEAGMPGRDMRAGKVLRLRRGLAEIEFDRGARVILQGPAGLVLISGNEARLLHGTLTARVPHQARGFTVLSPAGKVVDLGTEFGLSVDEQGSTAVRVFEGQVEAAPLGKGTAQAPVVTLRRDQSAQMDGHSVAVQPSPDPTDPRRFVRAIVPPPVIAPRSRKLDFSRIVDATLPDVAGNGTGLSHRLPGTGGQLREHDANLRLDTDRGVLELSTTRSDLNTQHRLEVGEYLGFRLKDLGFTGSEDFAISATIPDIPALEGLGQFGLYAGTRSDETIRGGLICGTEPERYSLFLVNNHQGVDAPPYYIRLMNTTGDDLKLTLRRIAGRYSLVVENRTKQTSSTLMIAHPAFLDGERDLYLGLFGANVQSDVSKTLQIKEVSVTVWTVSPGSASSAAPPLARAAEGKMGALTSRPDRDGLRHSS